MKYNKGFAPLIILLIVLGVLAVGGVAYFAGKSSTPKNTVSDNSNYYPPVNQNQNPTTTNNNPPAQTPPPVNNPPTNNPVINTTTTTSTKSNCLPTTSPWIKVASPNGGEIYPLSTVQNFTWQTCNIPSTAHLTGELVGISNPDNSKSLFGEGNDQGLSNDTGSLNDGQQAIDFGPILSTGVQWINTGTYKFKLSLFNTPSISDSSDNYFTIN